MLSSDNEESSSIKVSKNASNSSKNKIKILSQTLLKTANLASRKDFLNQALQNSSFTKLNKHTDIVSKQALPNKNDSSDNSNSGQTTFIDNIKKRTVARNSDVNDEELNNNRNKSKEIVSHSDSSGAEFERSIRKTQMSPLDVCADKLSSNTRTTVKKKMKEMLSDSSDSDLARHNKTRSDNNVTLRKKNKKMRPASSDSESDHAKRKRKLSDSSSSSSESDRSENENKLQNSKNREQSKVVSRQDDSTSSKTSSSSDSESDNKKSHNRNKSMNSTNRSRNISSFNRELESTKKNMSHQDDSTSSSASETERKKSSQRKPESPYVRGSKAVGNNPKISKTSSSSSDSESDNKKSQNTNKNMSSTSNKSNRKSSESSKKTKQANSSIQSSSDSDTGSETENTRRNKKNDRKESESSSEDSNSDNSDLHKKEYKSNEKLSKKSASSSKLKRKYDEMRSDDDSLRNESKKKRKRSDSTLTKQKPEAEKLLEQYLNQNEYKLVESKRPNPLDFLNKHDEVYLVQMSKSIDPQLLVGKKISFDVPTKLKIEKESYIWDIDTQNEYDINVINFANLINLKAKGIVTVQPRIKTKNSEIEMKPFVDDLDVPSDIKVRHPLFGTEYEERINLDDDIVKKLEEIVVNVDRKHKKKSKKKKDHKKDYVRGDDDVNKTDDALDIIKLLNEHEEQTVKNQENKKKKKSKHKTKDVNPDITEVETESILSQIFSDIETASKNLKKQTSLTENIDETPVLKKKKKHKRSLNLTEEMSISEPVVSELDEKPTKKSKKSKKHSLEMKSEETDTKKSNHEPEFVFASPVFDYDPPKKQKKKHREKDESKQNKKENVVVNSTMSTSSIGDTILQLDESCIPKAKKKKHKRKDSIDNFINDLVKDVTSSEESMGHKKKKHKKKHSRE